MSDFTQDQLDAAEEVMNFARATGNDKFAEVIRDFFDIQEKPIYDDSDSVFKNLSEKYNIGMHVQGYKTEDGVRYPFYSAEGDVREFEKLHEEIKQMRIG